MSAWCDLQRVAVIDADPGWFTGIEADLVPALRHSAQGRRWLADSIAPGFSLIEDVPPSRGDDAVVSSRPWLLASLRADHRLFRIAGALRALPWIRRQLDRRTVLTLDEVLGRELYGMLLAIQEEWEEPGRALDGLADDAVRMAQWLDERGQFELIHYGAALEPAIEDRFRLAIAPEKDALQGDAVSMSAVDTVAAAMAWEEAA